MNKPRRLVRKSWVLVLCLTLILSTFSAMYDSTTNEVHAAGGSGTEANPFLIETADELNNVRNAPTAHYKLIADIDLDVIDYNAGVGWLPIGDITSPFIGSFDGNGFIISGLTINRPTEDNIGLFGAVKNAQITNVNLEDVNVVGQNNVGGLVGYESNSNGTIIGSSVQGTVTGERYVGGMVGRTAGEIGSSSSEVEVSGNVDYVGGLVGQSGAAVSESLATGEVTAVKVVGGLIGYADATKIINSSATGNVTSVEQFAGGLVGNAVGSKITNSYATGEVEGTDKVGGLVGRIFATLENRAAISSSYAVGAVSGAGEVGGLAGYASADITESFATGVVIGTGADIGGLVGIATGNTEILNAYASGAVSGGSNVGALVGIVRLSGSITNSYATGKVTGGISRGGLVGTLTPDQDVIDSYYDRETTEQSDDRDKGIPKTSAEMKQDETFSTWDYNDVWFVEEDNSYPKLQQFVTGLNYDAPDYLLKVGGMGQAGLEVVYVDNSTIEITSSVKFETVSANIATASHTGELTGNAAGSTVLTATLGKISKDAEVKVSDIIYVKETGDDSNAGTSWATAFETLEKALAETAKYNVGDNVSIWIAKGTYYPSKRTILNDPRTATFQMKNGVQIRGGFAGNEPINYNITRRNFAVNETIISGNIGDPALDTDNVYHVFYHPAGLNLDHTALLDGVTITGGNDPSNAGGGMHNYESSPTLTHVIISGNKAVFGGGLFNFESHPILNNVEISINNAGHGAGVYNNDSNPEFTNVTIKDNTATGDGGGMENHGSNPVLTNVIISGNTAGDDGGGLSVFESDPILNNVEISGNTANNGGAINIRQISNPKMTNVTISANTATDKGGGIYDAGMNSNPIINNSIIWGNSSSIEHGLINNAKIANSLIEDSGGSDSWDSDFGINAGGNIDENPLFINPLDAQTAPTSGGNYRLKAGSPAIDAGDDSLVAAGVTTDLDENPRFRYGTVDMGAYEYYVAPPPIIVPGNGGGGGGGTGTTLPDETDPSPVEPTPTTPSVAFTDIAGHWAEEVIKQSVQDGIVNGYPDHTFRPDNSITRAEFTTMLANVLGLTGKGAELTFTDHKQIGTWALQAVAQVCEAGLSKGYEDGTFRPNNQITRTEIAVMIARALDLVQDATVTSFADDNDIPAWAKGAVEAVRLSGIIQGRGGNRFVPQDNATRAEALTMLMRMAEAK